MRVELEDLNKTYCDIALLEGYLSGGGDPNATFSTGESLFGLCVGCNHIDGIKMLLEAGADPSVNKNPYGTALHFTARNGYLDSARMLLRFGADVEAPDHWGNTPLHRAVQEAKSGTKMVELLLKFGANPDSENRNGVSPRGLAKKVGRSECDNLFSSLDS